MSATAPLPRGWKAREALTLAAHGPLDAVRSIKTPTKQLVAHGFLTDDLELTDKGAAAYAEMARPLDFDEFLRLDWVRLERLTADGKLNEWDGITPPPYITTVSHDGRTAYVCAHGGRREAAAVSVATIPDRYRPTFGLTGDRIEDATLAHPSVRMNR